MDTWSRNTKLPNTLSDVSEPRFVTILKEVAHSKYIIINKITTYLLISQIIYYYR